MRDRTPSNVPGPFYVAKDECITCGAPAAEAPTLIRHEEDQCGSCYFLRQPENPDDAYRALRAMAVSCVGAVRYGGSDPCILKRASQLGLAAQCDTPIPAAERPPRTKVTFRFDGSDGARHIAERLTAILPPYAKVSGRKAASFVYFWPSSKPLKVYIARAQDGPHRWLATIRWAGVVRLVGSEMGALPDLAPLTTG